MERGLCKNARVLSQGAEGSWRPLGRNGSTSLAAVRRRPWTWKPAGREPLRSRRHVAGAADRKPQVGRIRRTRDVSGETSRPRSPEVLEYDLPREGQDFGTGSRRARRRHRPPGLIGWQQALSVGLYRPTKGTWGSGSHPVSDISWQNNRAPPPGDVDLAGVVQQRHRAVGRGRRDGVAGSQLGHRWEMVPDVNARNGLPRGGRQRFGGMGCGWPPRRPRTALLGARAFRRSSRRWRIVQAGVTPASQRLVDLALRPTRCRRSVVVPPRRVRADRPRSGCRRRLR